MSPQVIRIAKSGSTQAPTLPVDAVTRTFGIFGMKDSGKTTTARVLVEGITKTGGHAIVFDPVGVWWGATRAGSGPGIPGVVIGGEHGDVPLEETGGKLVAELALARQYQLVVVDLKLLRKGAAQRFLADCLEELYFRNRAPLNVVFEEADRAHPQSARSMDPTLGRVLGAAEDIVKLGRSRGLGCTLISQRLATVNKNVTEQIESLILMRLVGPNDRKAAKGWIESNGDSHVTGEILDSMASLHQGEGWLYSPGWLRILEKVRIRESRTLDSSSTPTMEQAAVQDSAKRAPVSLDDLRSQMAESVERAKENDPAELRKKIVTLQREVSELTNTETPPAAEPEVQLVWPFSDEEFDAASQNAEDALTESRDAAERFGRAMEMMNALSESIGDGRKHAEWLLDSLRAWRERKDAEAVSLDKLIDVGRGNLITAGRPPAEIARGLIEKHAPALAKPKPPAGEARARVANDLMGAEAAAPSNGGVSRPQQKLLDSLAWFASIGVLAPRRSPLGAVAGTSPKSSGFEKNLSTLRTAGLIKYPAQGCVGLTEEGSGRAEWPEARATQAELQEAIYRMVSGPQAEILRALVSAYPESLTREELAGNAGVSPASSGFEKNLSTLRSFELADYPERGYVVATDLLFVNVRR